MPMDFIDSETYQNPSYKLGERKESHAASKFVNK